VTDTDLVKKIHRQIETAAKFRELLKVKNKQPLSHQGHYFHVSQGNYLGAMSCCGQVSVYKIVVKGHFFI